MQELSMEMADKVAGGRYVPSSLGSYARLASAIASYPQGAAAGATAVWKATLAGDTPTNKLPASLNGWDTLAGASMLAQSGFRWR